jgi:polyamine oxidase
MPDALRPRRALSSRWTTDPDYGTAYSYLRPGGTPADRDLLAEPPAPGLALAGEATWSEHPGTMHGAWFSGERAARQLNGGERPSRAIVVGAGLAGIAAARALVADGVGTVLLEASHTIGGRAATDRSLGGPVHTGAAWLHGDHGNPIAVAAQRLGIPATRSRWDATETFVRDQGALAVEAERRIETERARIDRGVALAQRRATPHEVLGPLLRRLLAEADVDATERLVLERWVIGIYENLYAAPVDDLSLLHSAEPFRLPGPDLTLLGGLDEIVADLASGLDVRLGHRVERVERAEGGWQVVADGERFRADAVVVTVPLGVLSAGRITFDPPLPSGVRTALTRMGTGVVTKVFLTFTAAFWSPRWSFSTVADPRPPFELWVDVSSLAGRPTLCAFATHARAHDVETASEAELCELAYQTLTEARVPGS